MTRGGSWREHLGALGLYAILSIALVDHGVSITHFLSGAGGDPIDDIWFLSWWPYAFAHHLDPFYTRLVWQPLGVCLGWITSVPALATLMAPVTIMGGPVLSYNLLVIAAPALSAWGAYRLCLRATGGYSRAAILGGVFFGFSNYGMAQDAAALNLAFCALVPLLTDVLLARLCEQIGRSTFIVLFSLGLAIQFYVSIEIFALDFVFGGAALILALLYFPLWRRRIWVCAGELIVAGILTSGLIAPLLWPMLQSRELVAHPAIWPYYFVVDLANFIIPGPGVWLGRLLPHDLNNFAFAIQEQNGYLGLPALVILIAFARAAHHGADRFLTVMVLLLMVSSLGPDLWVLGRPTFISMPWVIFAHLPFLNNALPTRFSLYTALTLAVVLARWAARPGHRGWRLVGFAFACLIVTPAPHPWMPIPRAAFFAPGHVETVLGPNKNLLILPFSIRGPSSAWQAAEGFGFAQTGAYLGFPPAPMQRYVAVTDLFGGLTPPDLGSEIAQFATATHTDFIIIGPGTGVRVAAAVKSLGWRVRAIDDVLVIDVPHA